jgi:site-specific recombinase XerD
MKTYDPENERIKHRYFEYMKEAKRYSDSSVNQIAAALDCFERYTNYKPFKAFHIEQAKGFKRKLAEQRSARTNEKLSKATLHSTLSALRVFFQWLAREPGFRSRLNHADAEYFNLSAGEVSIAKAGRDRPVPTVAQIMHVLRSMPSATEIEKRDRALIAFTLLTGARDGAIASFKLRHIDVEAQLLVQDARDVRTKFSKTIMTWFFPVGDEVEQIVRDWVVYLRDDKLWGHEDALFPSTSMTQNTDKKFAPSGFARKQWSNATPIRRIFKTAFERAGLPSFNPHSFRNTLAALGERLCRNPEEWKAWSQNLGHEKVLTTFTSYGKVAPARQAEIIRDLRMPRFSADKTAELFERLAREARAGRIQ